jgi:hypothetical protein
LGVFFGDFFFQVKTSHIYFSETNKGQYKHKNRTNAILRSQ